MAETIPPPPDPKDFFPPGVLEELEALASQTHPRLAEVAAQRLGQYREFYAQEFKETPGSYDPTIPRRVIGFGVALIALGLMSRDIVSTSLGGIFVGSSAAYMQSQNRHSMVKMPNTRAELIGGYMNRLLLNNQRTDER